MHHYNVPQKAMKGRSLGGKLGMTIFFRRYKVLESANFPWKTKTSIACLALAAFSIYVNIAAGPQASWIVRDLSIAVATISLILFLCLSFLFTAPTIGRLTWIRRAYLILIHHVLCRFMESIEWCTGTNKTGYMMHLTANKLLQHEYVTEQELQETTTMAIVRNPYSRMVSIYNYNKFGDAESFETFVQDWYHRMTKPYRERGELDEWYTPCHTIPQFEFTHSNKQGKKEPLIQCIIKQEEIKLLKKMDDEEAQFSKSSVSNLPQLVQTALLEMPHTNSRAGGKKWFEYYTQETLDLVYEMYAKDFEVFGYSPILKQRPDLKPPKLLHAKEEGEKSTHSSTEASGRTERSDDDDDSEEEGLQNVPLGSSDDDYDDEVSSQSSSPNLTSTSSSEDDCDSTTSQTSSRFDIQILEA